MHNFRKAVDPISQLSFSHIMKAVAAAAGGLTVLLTLLYRYSLHPWCLAAAISAGVTFYHFGMRLLVGWLLLIMTRNPFDYRCFWFRSHSWEPRLYRAIRLHSWKKHLPTYNPGTYDLKRNSLLQIIRTTCGAELVHELIMLLSFLPLLLIPRFGEPGVFWITSLLSALADSPFVLVQRYNRPRLVRIYEKQEAKTL